jgi:hypothetical protein
MERIDDFDLKSILIFNKEDETLENNSILSAEDLNYFRNETNPEFINVSFLQKSDFTQITDFTEDSKKKIIEILSKIFKNDYDIPVEDLNIHELKLIIVVLFLKFPKIQNIKNLFDQKTFNLSKKSFFMNQNEQRDFKKDMKEILTEILKIIPGYVFRKKNEEINKFLYKFTIKSLKKRFFKNEKLPIRKQKKLFFTHYFKNDCKKYNLKIQDYYDPLNVRCTRKTLNHDFLIRNLSNSTFHKDFFDFLDIEFNNNYSQITLKKFETIFKKYFKIFFEIMTNFDFELISNFKNTRIKFPWSLNEIEFAISQFKKKFY